jgi:choline-phosphate cytidylyltransferase
MTTATTPAAMLSEHSFFFTALERDRLNHVDTRSRRHQEYSFVTRIFRPVATAVSAWLIPDTVAPNTIALIGVVASMQALQVISFYKESHPDTAHAVASLLLLVSTACTVLDGVHAARCKSFTVVGRIFSETCDAIRQIFLALSVLAILGVADLVTQWYLAVALQLVRLAHTMLRMSPEVDKRGRLKEASYLFSATEAAVLHTAFVCFGRFLPVQPLTALLTATPAVPAQLYCGIVAVCFAACFAQPKASRTTIFVALALRMMPSFLVPLNDVSPLSVIADAVVVATMSVELTVSAMARRPPHSFLLFIAAIAMFNAVLGLFCCVLYVAGLLLDLSVTLKMPLFVPCRNVYIDGVFDLCHIGHKRLMENALKHGNRLVVGVMSDEDCCSYKRPPIMTTAERCTEVANCKFVSQVVPGAPCFGLTRAFLEEHNIHVVCYGAEYDLPTDKYYAAARELGIGVTHPRTGGMSTSELIKRISSASAAELAAKDALAKSPSPQPAPMSPKKAGEADQ